MGYQPEPMCVIEVPKTKSLANTYKFAEQSWFNLFGHFKSRLRQLHFVFFEFGDRHELDRRVLFTHQSFSCMVFDRCNSTVLEKDQSFAWASSSHRFSADNEICPSDVLELVEPSSTFDLNNFPEEGRPPWQTRC